MCSALAFQLTLVTLVVSQFTAELKNASRYDGLTGLLNRRAFEEALDAEVQRSRRLGEPFSVLMIDADHFKEINRRYLLPGGDQVLVGLAKTLKGSVRTVDHVGRIGGEEFLVVAPETNLEGAVVLGERIRSTVQGASIFYHNEKINVTVSQGIAVAESEAPIDLDQMRHVAAEALNEAKATGRNRCVVRSLLR